MKLKQTVKRKLSSTFIGIFILVVTLLVLVPFVHQQSAQQLTPISPTPLLNNLIIADGCIQACFFGIMPDMDDTSLEENLTRQGFRFEKKATGLTGDFEYTVEDSRLAILGKGAKASFWVNKQVISDILLGPSDLCTSKAFDSLGSPTSWRLSSVSYELYYPQQQLIIYIKKDQPDKVASIRLLSDSQYQYFSENPTLEKWDESFASRFNGCTH
ncbi:MAG: hypothetical protein OHK0023_21210 [Anaerolineae bacterium]